MAESILYGAVSNILSKLVLNAGQDLGLIFGWKKELEKLQGTLSTIKAVLLDAEEKQKSSHAMKNWISRLEDVVYDADDLLDKFDYAILRQKVLDRRQVRKFFSSSNPIAFGSKMGPRIKEIRERLDSIAADISKFDLRKRVVEPDKKAKYICRETASKVRSELIIGREKDKELIIESLLKKQNNQHGDIPVVAIVGLGGLGKTSLAQLVYADAEVKCSFDQQIWVCVSEDFNTCKIFKEILKSLGSSVEVDNLNLEQVLTKLEENLGGQRYLLVLDDVWEENKLEWDDFSKYLVRGALGSKILVTTRSMIVASAMGVRDTYLLEGLNEDQSWDLFKQVAFQGQSQIDADLSAIGEDVARRCKGVPLALKCLGGLMRQKPNKNYWSSVQENGIWKSLEKYGNTISVLRLSYDHLPSHLKQCFVFCSLFPKDSMMYKDELIYYWGAQGYIQLRGENENMQDIGDEYFNDLLSRSFFQEEGKNHDGNIFCKMHDLIHDVAESVAGRQFHWMKNEKEKKLEGVRHVSLEENFEALDLILLSKTKGIRTIFFSRYIFNELFINNVTLFSLDCLRMLNLSWVGIDILSDSIGKLKHLRYLDLSNNFEIKVLPNTITKLHHLQTLLLNSCFCLEELPRDLEHLISLEYLNIDDCDALKYLSKGLGKLTSLQRLDRFIVNSVEESAAMLNELRDLNDLRNSLTIERLGEVRNVELESKEANLKKKKGLQSLKLDWSYSKNWSLSSPTTVASESLLNNLEPHPNLKELEVFDYGGARFSSWLSSLTNLVKLTITRFWKCQCLPPLDHFSSLKSLTLDYSYALKHLPPLDHLSSLECLDLMMLQALEYVADSYPLPCSTSRKPFFPSLKILKIRQCHNLKGWWRTKNENQGSIAERPCFPCLSMLEIVGCPDLTSMPLFPSLDQNLTLEDASIRPLQQTWKMKMKMTEASMTSEEASSSSGSTCHSYSSTTLPLSNLRSLRLEDIKDLEFLLEELPLPYCPKLESLLPQKMSCLTSLQQLSVKNCPNLKALPDWILDLTSLTELQIQECLELQSMPKGTHQLTSLKELSIENCPKLRALPDWILDLTSLKALRIWGCRELQYMPEGISRLTSLEELRGDCHNLRAWQDWILNLASLKDLHICECLESPHLQEGMHSLTSLQRLMVETCPNLSSSRGFINTLLIRGCPGFYYGGRRKPLSSFEELNVQNCHDLEKLWSCIQPSIHGIKTLKIFKCPELQDMPGWMRYLTSLQVLSISECPQLSERCEKETGILWPRIASIPSIIIDGRQIQ